ncbi:MAG TPA: PHB depolymerase family esterase [bacterium]
MRVTLLAGAAMLACPAESGWAQSRRGLPSGGRMRAYWVDAPAVPARTGRRAVVIFLHGDGGTARRAAARSGLGRYAHARGFIAVYPEGTSMLGIPWRSWNAGACCGYAAAHRVDDTAFLDAVIDAVIRDEDGDPGRVYVAGVSNGGMMAHRAACELAGRVAAVASVAGTLAVEECRPAAPVSILEIHGTADRRVPYGGGYPADGDSERLDRPVGEVMAFWARHNGCRGEPERREDASLRHERYRGCAAGAAVELLSIRGAGHAWPGDVVSPAERMLEFFALQ